MKNKWLRKTPLYLVLALIVILVNSLVLGVFLIYSYVESKKTLIHELRNNSETILFRVVKLTTPCVESFEINECKKIIESEMSNKSITGIVITDYNAGKIFGTNIFYNGKVRDVDGELKNYNSNFDNLLKNSFLIKNSTIFSSAEEKLSTIDIYFNDKYLIEKLNNNLKKRFFIEIISSIILILLLIFFIKKIILFPINKIVNLISNNENGIPNEKVPVAGIKEFFILSISINAMISKIKKEKKALIKANQTYEATIDAVKEGIWEWNIQTNETIFSERWIEMLGYQKEDIKNNANFFFNLIHPDDKKKLHNCLKNHLINPKENEYKIKVRIRCKEGNYKWILTKGQVVKFENGTPILMLGTHTDVTKEKEKERLINDYYKLIDENVMTSTTNLEGYITYISEAYCKKSGYTKEELLGKKHSILKSPEMKNSLFKNLWHTIICNKTWEGEIKNLDKNQNPFWLKIKINPRFNDNGEKIGYISTNQDISDKKRIEEISIKDELTNLYNRRYFNKIFENEINRAKREHSFFALIILDIDHFKQYNDTYGHQQGDTVLNKIGQKLNNFCKRSSDYAFRVGGEEFAIIFKPESKEDAINFAERINKEIELLKIEHKNSSVSQFITISIGLFFGNGDNLLPSANIYNLTDQALYKAKNEGRNRVSIYSNI